MKNNIIKVFIITIFFYMVVMRIYPKHQIKMSWNLLL